MKFFYRTPCASRRGLLASGLCLLLATGPAAPWLFTAAAQQGLIPASANGGPIVRQIDVQFVGRPTITRERVLANMRTAIGQPFSQTTAEDDTRSLFASKDISNVRIFSEPLSDGVKVIVIVQTTATVKDIVIVGAQRLKPRSLLKQLTLKKNKPLTEQGVEEDRQKLLDYYRDKGFPDAEVRSSIAMDEPNSTGVVTFTVNEGGKSTLEHVIFQGNHAIKSQELRFTMKGTRGKTFYSFIDKSGRLDQTKLKEDLDSIRELYQNRGYVDIDIVETKIQHLSNGDENLVIVLNEGRQYRVGSLTFEGTQIFTDAEIRRFLKMKEGAVYSPKGLKDDVKTVEDYYGSRGYVDTHVTPSGQPLSDNRVALHYKIDEGGQSFVERVNISGNTTTKDKVIRREIPVAPGDIYNTVLVDAAKRRLENLGYFEKVDTSPVDTLVPDRKDLDVLVQEKRTGSLSFGAGFSSIDSLVGQVELTQSNFDITNLHGFTGGGQRFRLLLEYGLTRKDFVLSLTEPYFLDTRTALGGEIFYHEADYLSNDYNQTNYGLDVNVRRSLGRFIAGSLEYRFEDVDISDVNTNSSILQQEVGARTRSAVRATLSYDTRDSVTLTRSGTRVDFSPFIAGLGGDTKDYGFDLTASRYFRTPLDGILLFNGEIASVDTYNGGDRVPINDRLYLGGPNNLRGFGFRKVGPLDYKSNPVGGRSLVRYTVEDTYPVITRMRVAVFTDGGYVNQDSFDFVPRAFHGRNDFRGDPNAIDRDPKTPPPDRGGSDLDNIVFGGDFNMDVGIGVRLDLPIGPIRLDYGYPILSNEMDIRHSGKFNFNVGYQF